MVEEIPRDTLVRVPQKGQSLYIAVSLSQITHIGVSQQLHSGSPRKDRCGEELRPPPMSSPVWS